MDDSTISHWEVGSLSMLGLGEGVYRCRWCNTTYDEMSIQTSPHINNPSLGLLGHDEKANSVVGQDQYVR
jgi:hypothetical protein